MPALPKPTYPSFLLPRCPPSSPPPPFSAPPLPPLCFTPFPPFHLALQRLPFLPPRLFTSAPRSAHRCLPSSQIRMKALPCPCPALPRCWRPGSHSMAQGSGTQSLGKGPPLSVQLLRAQYERWRRQQRAQAHLVVLPKGRARQVLGRRGGEEGRVPGQEGRGGGCG